MKLYYTKIKSGIKNADATKDVLSIVLVLPVSSISRNPPTGKSDGSCHLLNWQ